MLKLVNLSLVLFLTAIVYAGSDNVKVTWGPEHKAISRQQPVAFLGNTKTGFIQVSNERGRLLTIQSFSPALELKSVTLVDSKILPKGYELVDCLKWGSKYYLFYSTWNRKEATERLFVKEISLEQGTLVGTAKELLACEKIAGDFQINSMVSFVTNNKFKLQFGPDSSTLGVFVQYRRAVESNGKKENNLYGFWKFDKDFNTLWKQPLVTMPLHFWRLPKGIYQYDKDGNFLFLKSVRTNDSIKNTIENSINSHKEIVKFGAKFQEPVFVTLPLYDKRISQSYLNLDVNGYPVCTGYYIKPGLDWTPAIDEINTDGAFMQRLTGWGDTIEDVRTNVYKFKDEMLTSIKSKTGQGIPEKNKTKEEQAKRSVDIKNTIIEDDGSVTIIGEISYFYISGTTAGRNPTTIYTYCANDIFVQHINKDGTLLWSKVIPKLQASITSAKGLSYRVTKHNGNLYFLFMEGLPTEESISNEASATFTGGYKGVLSCVKISNSGEMSKTTLFDCKKQGQLITLEQGEFLNSNTFVISSEMGPNSVTNRNKLCLIEFE